MTAARGWLPATVLAGLEGMPGTARSVRRKADAEGWAFVDETARGGQRRLYDPAALPAVTRAALKWANPGAVVSGPSPAAQAGQAAGAQLALQAELDRQAASGRRLEGLKRSQALPATAQRRLDAKLELVRAFELWAATNADVPKAVARIAFADLYNRGSAECGVQAWAREAVPGVSAASLQRWQGTIKGEGIAALAGRYGNRRGAGKVDTQPQLRELVVGMLVKFPHARATHVMQGLRARLADSGVDLPSVRSLERWIDGWRSANKQTLTALANPDAWKNQFMVAFGSQSEGIKRLNQRWELDSTPGDVMLLDGRHTLIGGIDVYSRRPKLYVTKTSKATAVATLVRHMLLDYGVPEVAKTDNGSDYTSQHVTRVFRSLDIHHELCPPFQPWHKPHIERFFGTFSRDLVELLAGFIGHNVAERSAIEARKSFAERLMQRDQVVEVRMTAEEFQDFCDRWVDDVYMHRPHEGLAGRTPFELVAGWAEPVRTITDERALDVLLAEAAGSKGGMLAVQKKGLKTDNGWFIAPELEAYVGQRVRALTDPLDLGRLFVFGGDDLHFLCIAECPERTGMSRQEVAAKARELQKKRVQEERRALRAASKRAGTDEIVQDILRERAAAAGKLRQLPRPTVGHTSEGLAAAAEAAAERDTPRRTTAELADITALQEARRRIAAEEVIAGADNELARRRGLEVPPTFNSVPERMHWLLRQSRFRALTTEEQDSLAQFKRAQPASYRRLDQLVSEQVAQRKNEDPAATGSA